MTEYRGDADGKVFVVNGKKKKLLNARIDLAPNLAPALDWGTKVAGSRLALAILADHLKDDAEAVRLASRFKWRVIVELPAGKPWTITADKIDATLDAIRGVERDTAGQRAAVAREPTPVVSEGGPGLGWRK